MTTPKPNLAQLRIQRDQALNRTAASADSAQGLIPQIKSFAAQHPCTAIGTAAAVGIAAGMLMGPSLTRRLVRTAGLLLVRPLVVDLAQDLMRTANGDSFDES